MSSAQFARYTGSRVVPFAPHGHAYGPGVCKRCGCASADCRCGCRQCRKEAKELTYTAAADPRGAVRDNAAVGLAAAHLMSAAAAAPGAAAAAAPATAFVGGGCCVHISLEYAPITATAQSAVAILVRDTEGTVMLWEKINPPGTHYQVKECVVTTKPGVSILLFAINATVRVAGAKCSAVRGERRPPWRAPRRPQSRPPRTRRRQSSTSTPSAGRRRPRHRPDRRPCRPRRLRQPSLKTTAGPFPGSGLTWAVPLGVGTAPVYFGGPPPGPGGPGPGGAAGPGGAVGGLTEGIGTTLRLGVDLLNAALFNSAKILGGFTGTYGYGHHDDGGYGCGCGCESCCEPSCCQPDCCGLRVLQPRRGGLLFMAEHPHAADAETIGAHILPPQQPWGDTGIFFKPIAVKPDGIDTIDILSGSLSQEEAFMGSVVHTSIGSALCLVECPGALEVNRSDGQDHTAPTAASGSRKSSSSGRTRHLTAARGSRNAGTSRP